jgi:LytS/YehU family sensor histidine kinase/ligand-binding sensor domain-containing protein
MCDVSGQAFPKFAFTRSNCANNLPIDVCTYVTKDSEGFLWISTANGFCRYDGKNLTVFKNDPLDKTSIASNQVGYILEDKEGNIWVTHKKGISCFLKKEGKFKNYNSYINLKGDTIKLKYNPVVKDGNDNIYCPDTDGYENLIFDQKLNSFRALYIDTTNDGYNHKNNSNTNVGVLSAMQWDGSMYLQSNNGTFLFDPKTNKRKRVSDSSTYIPLFIFKDYKKQLWLTELDGGLSIINEKTKEKKTIIPNNRIYQIIEYKDINDKYWLIASDAKTSSIYIIDPETKAYTSQVFKIENEISPNVFPGILSTNKDGKLYITSSLGLAEATPSKQYINNVYTYELGKPTNIYEENLVRCGTQKSNGDYIICLLGYNGLRIYDSNVVLKKVIKQYRYDGKQYDLNIQNISKLNDDRFLLTGITGISLLENNTITPIKYISKNEVAKDSLLPYVREVLPINENEYWIKIAYNGLYIFNIKTKSFVKQYQFADKAKKQPLNKIRTMLYDNQKRLWLLDLNNLYLYNANTDEFVKQAINGNSKYLSSMYNMLIVDDVIWITGVGGVLAYNMVTKKEIFYTQKNGLQSAITYKLLLYNKETICISTELGIAILNTTTGNIIDCNKKKGLPFSTLDYDVAFYLDNAQNIILGNAGIITKIEINKLLLEKKKLPTLAFTSVQGSDSTIAITLNEKNEKHAFLNFKNFPVNINFSIIDFSTNGERKYFYRYTGKDTTWIPCANGVVPINTIEPGDYTLEVMGSVNGVFTSKIESIIFTIVPRWHETWWFKLLAGIALFIGISSLYRWRINTAKASQKQQTEIQRLAAQEYKNQLELNQISNYFSTSLINLESEEEVLWDVAKNLIGKLGFEDCIIYLWNKDKTKLIQRAGYGPKGSIEELDKQPFDVVLGQGVVGNVALTKESILIQDTRNDSRYRVDEMERLSEICVPILHNNELIGIIDSEHSEVNFYTQKHLQSLTSIAAHLSNKLEDIKSKLAIKKNSEELQRTLDLLKGAQLEALRSQMNPHFIFNCLNSIKLYTTQNDTVAASNYLTKFSKLIRLALENSKSETIPLSTELEALELYIEMEAMRFKEKLKYSIIINENVDADFIEIPPLLLQPFVENSIWHGLMHKEEGGSIDIHVSIVPQKYILEITIKDDGVGREKAAFLKSKSATSHKSFGTKVTSDRLEIVNQLYKTGASVHTEDVLTKNEVTGTLVTLRIPFE